MRFKVENNFHDLKNLKKLNTTRLLNVYKRERQKFYNYGFWCGCGCGEMI